MQIKKFLLKRLGFLKIPFFIFIFLITLSQIAFAQEAASQNNENNVEEVALLPLKAIAGEDKNIVVGRQVIFSGISSINPTDQPLNYYWDFGDNFSAIGEEVSHVYSQAGVYRATLTIEDVNKNKDTAEIIVSVDEDLILLVTDKNAGDQEIKDLQRYASTQKILLVSVRNDKNEPDYVISKELAKQLIESKDNIKQAGTIVLWTSGSTGINSMLEVAQSLGANLENTDLGFTNKNIIAITDKSFSATARIAQNVFDFLQPKYIILTTEDALQFVCSTVNTNDLIEGLKNNNYKYQLVGLHSQRTLEKLGFFNFMSVAVNYMVNRGVSLNTIFLILILPLIATIIAFARQVIGFQAFGIYIPSIITLSFVSLGLKYGLIIFAVIISTGTMARFLAKKIKILYMPRMAIVLSVVSLFIFLLFLVGTFFDQPQITSVSIFPILIMTFMTEKFITAQIEQGTKTAIILSLETLLLSIVCYYVANWKELEILILGYPELILITFAINILIGRFAGLRLIEHIRFRNLFKNV